VTFEKNPEAYSSVRHWMEAVNARHGLSGRDWAKRLAVLWGFCESLGKDPDTVIREALDERGSKLDYMRHLRRWASGQAKGPQAVHELQNIIRSFFINNGARVLTKPYPDVYSRGGSTSTAGEAHSVPGPP
jgi:hypothetical protein